MKKLALFMVVGLITIGTLFAKEAEKEKQDHYFSIGPGYGYYVSNPFDDNNASIIHGPSISLLGEDTIDKEKNLSIFSNLNVLFPLEFITSGIQITDFNTSYITNFTVGSLFREPISENTASYVGAGIHLNVTLITTDNFAMFNVEGGIGTLLGIKTQFSPNAYFDIGLHAATDFIEWANYKNSLGETSEFTEHFFGAGANAFALFTYKM